MHPITHISHLNLSFSQNLAKEIREFRSPTDGETRMFYEIVVAPSYTEQGLATLKGKSKTLRILEAKARAKGKQGLRQVGGGWLLQDADDKTPEDIEFKVSKPALHSCFSGYIFLLTWLYLFCVFTIWKSTIRKS